ncbi:DUF3761 domain-containing protein [Sphingomonas sp. GlSt437]|uniref:DUF3761 domain-containing protein n=1 Tax=Sphingomonas sp. GlSt437 TaxID=3389970 RepID=UPI003A87601B
MILLAPAAAEARHYSHHHAAYGRYDASGSYYTARSGHRVHRPVFSRAVPAGASARCRDGTWSFSESHRGSCSHHGGVDRWL